MTLHWWVGSCLSVPRAVHSAMVRSPRSASRSAPPTTPHLATTPLKRVPAIFYRTEAGNEPVRDWLKSMDREDRRRIGEDVKLVEYGWPIGMPTCRAMGEGLHEVRTDLPNNRIARVLFYIEKRQRM